MLQPKFKVYSTVTGDFSFVTLKDLVLEDNSRISSNMFDEDLSFYQYIGIVDSDNKDIYVGDILQNQVDKVLLNWLVCFNGYSFTVKNIGLTPIKNTQEFTINSPLMFIDRKVIGNMHTHPELMISED